MAPALLCARGVVLKSRDGQSALRQPLLLHHPAAHLPVIAIAPVKGCRVTACCSSPHSLPQQKLENWRRGMRRIWRLKSAIPVRMRRNSLHPSLGFLPVHYVGFHFFHPSSKEDPLATSEILIFTYHSSCCSKVSEV